MQLHELQPTHRRKTAKRIGRGGKRGKTSGRGMKGQKARAGNSTRPEMRDIIKKLPKLRGHGKNRAKTVNSDRTPAAVVKLAALEVTFAAGDKVTPVALVAAGLIKKRGGKLPPVKLLAVGELSKKLDISGLAASASARLAVEKAGGTVA